MRGEQRVVSGRGPLDRPTLSPTFKQDVHATNCEDAALVLDVRKLRGFLVGFGADPPVWISGMVALGEESTDDDIRQKACRLLLRPRDHGLLAWTVTTVLVAGEQGVAGAGVWKGAAITRPHSDDAVFGDLPAARFAPRSARTRIARDISNAQVPAAASTGRAQQTPMRRVLWFSASLNPLRAPTVLATTTGSPSIHSDGVEPPMRRIRMAVASVILPQVSRYGGRKASRTAWTLEPPPLPSPRPGTAKAVPLCLPDAGLGQIPSRTGSWLTIRARPSK
jgi:hypothetical protein